MQLDKRNTLIFMIIFLRSAKTQDTHEAAFDAYDTVVSEENGKTFIGGAVDKISQGNEKLERGKTVTNVDSDISPSGKDISMIHKPEIDWRDSNKSYSEKFKPIHNSAMSKTLDLNEEGIDLETTVDGTLADMIIKGIKKKVEKSWLSKEIDIPSLERNKGPSHMRKMGFCKEGGLSKYSDDSFLTKKLSHLNKVLQDGDEIDGKELLCGSDINSTTNPEIPDRCYHLPPDLKKFLSWIVDGGEEGEENCY